MKWESEVQGVTQVHERLVLPTDAQNQSNIASRMDFYSLEILGVVVSRGISVVIAHC